MIKDDRPRRCAVYTRKSTDENMSLEFTSLDNQRTRAEHYIASQSGWTRIEERYDDAGYSGGNLERPALKRLLADIEAGEIDAVVVYRADRLSRSLKDFGELIEFFDQHEVTFTSVTEAFSTSSPAGRMFLNMLLTFAQYERELVSERTAHKIAAARQRGQWTGGKPILGYDVERDDRGSRLIVNDAEASQVRELFDLYLKHESLIAVVRIANDRGWTTKRWQTKGCRSLGGARFNKSSMHHFLTNVAYLGKVSHKGEIYEGRHDAIIAEDVLERVQTLMKRNATSGGAEVRNKHGALLRGLLHCSACDRTMTHTYTKKGNVRYRYYTCTRAQSQGWHTCPSKSVPATEIERFIIDEIKSIGQDDDLCTESIAAARREMDARLEALFAERTRLIDQVNADNGQLASGDDPVALHARIGKAEKRLREIASEAERLQNAAPTTDEIEQALRDFAPVWESLSTAEQVRMLKLLIRCIDYDGSKQSITIHYHPTAFSALCAKRHGHTEAAA